MKTNYKPSGVTRSGLVQVPLKAIYKGPNPRAHGDGEEQSDQAEPPVVTKIFTLVDAILQARPSPADEASRAGKLLARFGGDRNKVARRMGLHPAVLARRLDLLNATDKVLEALKNRVIRLDMAELLAAKPRSAQDVVLAKLLAIPKNGSWEAMNESLTVRFYLLGLSDTYEDRPPAAGRLHALDGIRMRVRRAWVALQSHIGKLNWNPCQPN